MANIGRILLVGERSDVRRAHARGLRRWAADHNYAIEEHADGQQALNDFARADAVPVAGILALHGMSGLDLLKEVRKNYSLLPFVLLSSETSHAQAVTDMNAVFLEKMATGLPEIETTLDRLLATPTKATIDPKEVKVGILVAMDDRDLRKMIIDALRVEFPKAQVTEAWESGQTLIAFRTLEIGIVIADMTMKDELRQIRASDDKVQLLLLSQASANETWSAFAKDIDATLERMLINLKRLYAWTSNAIVALQK